MAVKLIPYFVMKGNATEAIQFYEKTLGAKVAFKQTFGEMPENPEMPLPAEAKSLVSHATIQIGEDVIMFSDTFPGQPHQSGNQVTICISSNDKEQSSQFFQALKEGGQVEMPLQETFFSPAYAIVIDKFGVTWQIFTDSHQ
ncbi:VOC family protein [Paenibacillus donghaensis]|uniref:VOC family protein n=1 Tax=Paenibacillus donghaensis TaxID=414771 RepID=UPI001883744E|nr:VOC family protein [Paenibacillus donghaensis]MBE9914299.1 VOC family protein [Paenibacillus donghaensis]